MTDAGCADIDPVIVAVFDPDDNLFGCIIKRTYPKNLFTVIQSKKI